MTNLAPRASKASASKYTPAMEAELRDLAASATGLNAEVAATFAAKHGLAPRSVIAKITRMELPYAKKVRVTKSGGKIESKAAIAAQLSAIIGQTVDSLENASKADLQAVRDYIVDLARKAA